MDRYLFTFSLTYETEGRNKDDAYLKALKAFKEDIASTKQENVYALFYAYDGNGKEV